MAILDQVSERYDSEKPNAATLNELLNELKTLFSGGLPSTVMTWPVVAQGPIDMGGYPLYNVGASSGVINVSDSKTFAEAIDEVQDNGVILIDPGVNADKGTDTLVLDKNNVTILGYGMSSKLNFPDTTATGVGLKVTGDNFTLCNLVLTCDASITNMTDLVLLEGVEHYSVHHLYLDSPQVNAITVGNSSGTCYHGNMYGIDGDDAADNFIDIGYAQTLTIIGCSLDAAGTNCINLPSGGICDYVSITGNTLHNRTGNACIGGGPAAYTANHDWLTIAGNTLEADGKKPLDIGVWEYATVVGNILRGDMTLSLRHGTFEGNTTYGDVTIDTSTHSVFGPNRIIGALVLGSGNARNVINGVSVTDDLSVPASPGFDMITNVRCEGAISGLGASDVDVYDNNYAVGGVS